MGYLINPYKVTTPAVGGAVFRSGFAGGSGPAYVKFGTGTVAGDFVIIFSLNGATTISGGSGGWNHYAGSWYHGPFDVFWKAVTSLDVSTAAANGMTVGTPWEIVTLSYTGATAASVRSVVSRGPTGGTSLTITGFSKSGGCKGILALCTERDPVIPGTPAGFTSRITDVGTFSFETNATDLLGTAYVDGAGITFTGLSTANGEQAFALEMT